MADYIPGSEGQLGPWLANLESKLPTHSTAVGMTPGEQTDILAAIADARTAIDNKQAHKTECQSIIAAADAQIESALAMVRTQVRRVKAHAGYTPTIGEDLGIVAPATVLDPDTIKPALATEVFPGKVVLRFKKRGAQSVKLFSRKLGEMNWKFVTRDLNSPYEDTTPLTQAGVPEQREYCARGMINDHEVGQLSDTVTAVFAG